MPSPTPVVLGKIVLNSQGDILKSGGDLQNDERTAAVLTQLISAVPRQGGLVRRISLHYTDHSFSVVVSHGQVHILKLRREAPSDDFRQSDD